MDVKIDFHESKRVDKAKSYYIDECGFDVIVERLDTGDFVFDDKVVFEYKTVSDFIGSIQDGRVFDEALRQKEVYPYHFVIIEGTDKVRQNELYKLYKLGVKFTMKQYYGALARLNTYTNVIFAPNPRKAFQIMKCQTEKCLDSKPIVRVPNSRTSNPAFNLLMFLPNIGESKAELLVNKLDLYTYEDLANLSFNRLVEVKGIGRKTAENILSCLKDYTIQE